MVVSVAAVVLVVGKRGCIGLGLVGLDLVGVGRVGMGLRWVGFGSLE